MEVEGNEGKFEGEIGEWLLGVDEAKVEEVKLNIDERDGTKRI